jgi:hypothetical protein
MATWAAKPAGKDDRQRRMRLSRLSNYRWAVLTPLAPARDPRTGAAADGNDDRLALDAQPTRSNGGGQPVGSGLASHRPLFGWPLATTGVDPCRVRSRHAACGCPDGATLLEASAGLARVCCGRPVRDASAS